MVIARERSSDEVMAEALTRLGWTQPVGGKPIAPWVLPVVLVGESVAVIKTRGIRADTVTAGRFMTLEENGVDYQVPAGKQFRMTRIQMFGAAGNVCVGYGDDGVAESAAGPTNYTDVIGLQGSTGSISAMRSTTANTDQNIAGIIPAGKFPCVFNVAATVGVLITGIEENAY